MSAEKGITVISSVIGTLCFTVVTNFFYVLLIAFITGFLGFCGQYLAKKIIQKYTIKKHIIKNKKKCQKN